METLRHKFVDAIPEKLEAGTLYISMQRRTALHLCICGCGNEVPTPFSPTDWQLSFDGENISLTPSIGNWEFPCRSHYWITNSCVEKAGNWDDEQVQRGRDRDKKRKGNYYAKSTDFQELKQEAPLKEKSKALKRKSRFDKLKLFFASFFN
jgi:hypothetical protein